jgi:serine protease inhibitor
MGHTFLLFKTFLKEKQMAQLHYFWLFLGFLFLGNSCGKEKQDPLLDKKKLALTQEQRSAFSAANDFGFELFSALSPEFKDENLVISPLSIRMALSMLANGAEENTLQEILQTMGVSQSLEQNNLLHQSLLEILSSIDQKVLFKSAQSIWHDEGFEPKADFLEVNRLFYDAKIFPLDFSNPISKDLINDWVAQATQQKIKTIVEDISPDHVLFLINAIYYKGAWRKEFEKKNTFPSTFFMENQQEVPVEMMFSSEVNFGYFRDEKIEMVRIPFGRGNFQLTAMMPSPSLALDDLIAEVSQSNWQNWQSQLTEDHGLHLYFPKFEVEAKMELSAVLASLGMPEVFTSKANLKAIHPTARLEVNEINHKTFLKIDEEGAEAAAATSVGIVVTSLPPSVIFNRPFLVFIHELETDCILFLGSIREP